MIYKITIEKSNGKDPNGYEKYDDVYRQVTESPLDIPALVTTINAMISNESIELKEKKNE